MSLRLQVNLIVTLLMALFSSLLIGLQIDGTRRSVHEEVGGANIVATQLLRRVAQVYRNAESGAMAGFLADLGRVRANDIELLDSAGKVLYRSPPSPYKAGRDAPLWYAAIVSPPLAPQQIELPVGRLVVRANTSRATLDGWDELRPLLLWVLAGFVGANALVYALLGRALKPLDRVVQGLRDIERGDYGIRLAPLHGREGRAMGLAFNRMAQAVQDSDEAKRQAQQAAQALAANRELTQLIQARVEQERGAIARELHDELGQQVTAIKSAGAAILLRAGGKDEGIAESARLVVQCADQMYGGMHGMIARLRPLALDQAGLREALLDLLTDWRVAHLDKVLSMNLDAMPEKIGEAQSTAIYRVTQEAVNNALRHAGASRIGIDISVQGGRLVLEVADNGSGRLAKLDSAGRFGVLGMRERIEALGGSLELLQVESGGIRVRAVLDPA